MSATTILWLDAISDFFITAGGTIAGGMMEQGAGAHQMPGMGTLTLALVLGVVALFKQVKARVAEPAK